MYVQFMNQKIGQLTLYLFRLGSVSKNARKNEKRKFALKKNIYDFSIDCG